MSLVHDMAELLTACMGKQVCARLWWLLEHIQFVETWNRPGEPAGSESTENALGMIRKFPT